MPYSVPADVRKALVPTSDGSLPATPTHTAADLSDPQIANMIHEADSLIDGYLGKHYKTPVSALPVPDPIPAWSRNLAAYEAVNTYRQGMDYTDNDPVARRYQMTMDALKAVSKGDITLDLVPNNQGETGGPVEVAVGSAVNPYSGDLWTPDDFQTAGSAWPGRSGPAYGPYWGR